MISEKDAKDIVFKSELSGKLFNCLWIKFSYTSTQNCAGCLLSYEFAMVVDILLQHILMLAKCYLLENIEY